MDQCNFLITEEIGTTTLALLGSIFGLTINWRSRLNLHNILFLMDDNYGADLIGVNHESFKSASTGY